MKLCETGSSIQNVPQNRADFRLQCNYGPPVTNPRLIPMLTTFSAIKEVRKRQLSKSKEQKIKMAYC